MSPSTIFIIQPHLWLSTTALLSGLYLIATAALWHLTFCASHTPSGWVAVNQQCAIKCFLSFVHKWRVVPLPQLQWHIIVKKNKPQWSEWVDSFRPGFFTNPPPPCMKPSGHVPPSRGRAAVLQYSVRQQLVLVKPGAVFAKIRY